MIIIHIQTIMPSLAFSQKPPPVTPGGAVIAMNRPEEDPAIPPLDQPDMQLASEIDELTHGCRRLCKKRFGILFAFKVIGKPAHGPGCRRLWKKKFGIEFGGDDRIEF